jgi:flagellar basal-body rod modification protein FlgD
MTTTSPTSSASDTSLLSKYLQKQAAAVSSASSSASSSGNASSTSAKMQEVANNFDTFISILTTQLKNQDPTSASDTNQFTQELVMFAQAEQQLATNSKLDTLNSYAEITTTSAYTNYLGEYVETSATTSQIVVQNGTAEFAYSLADTPQSVAVTITNSSGATVATMSGPTSSGSHLVEWDGKDSSEKTVKDGTYNISVKETGSNGTASSVSSVYLVGKVTGVSLNGTSSTLSIGDLSVDASKVKQVFSSVTTASSTSDSSS